MKPSLTSRLWPALFLLVVALTVTPAAHAQRGRGRLSISPSSLSFGNQVQGLASAPRTVTLTNSRSSAVTLSVQAATGDFSETNTCPGSLTGGTSCTISVTFLPTATGRRTGSISIQAGTGTQTVNLSGNGTAPTVTAVVVAPATPSVLPGATQQFTATASYSNNTTADVTATATWSSSATSVATIASGGMATALAGGTATITASLSSGGGGGFGGGRRTTVRGTTVLTVASLTAITVTPNGVQLLPANTAQYTATGTYSNGVITDVTAKATWSSSSTSIATVNTTGLATSVAVGTATITASMGSGATTIRGTSALTVTTNPLVSIAITPTSISLGKNAVQQYVATGTYYNTTTANISTAVTWASGTPSVVSINAAGLATVLGTSTSAIPITASSGLVTSPPSWLSALSTLPVVCPTPTIDMKILVVTNGKTEADFGAITQVLDYMGTPYSVLDFAANPAGVTPDLLSDGDCHGYFQGVIFATGGYIYTLPGMQTLNLYEESFGVRQVNWYTDPTPDFGLNFTSTTVAASSTEAYSASYSAAAAPIFSYANTATPLVISNAFIYLTTPVAAASLPAGNTVTPLLTDASGNALSAIYSFADGRTYLTQTFDSSQYLTHDLVLAYGLINWVTKGIFLGDYHVYAAAQVDDLFINDSEWIPNTPCTDPITHDRTPPDASSLPVFRVTSSDMTSLVNWQNSLQTDPITTGFKLTLAFNGVGTTGNIDWTGLRTAGRTRDSLLSNLSRYQGSFHWISHTYDHPATLNGLCKSTATGSGCGDTDNPAVDHIDLEILTNMYVANGTGQMLDTDLSDTTAPAGVVPLMLTDFNPINLISPGVTGLNDPNVPGYLAADGIQYVVTDTSVIGQPNNGPNPSPNVGIVNSFAPGIYEVPRYPNDVYYNAANWADDQAEFHCIYNNPVAPPFSTYNAAQILDFVSTSFVVNMLKGDMNPQMFHQPNLHFSNNATNLGLTGTHNSSLLTDTYSQTFTKYKALYKLPILSLTLDQLGQRMQGRNAYNLSDATATLINVNGAAPQISITVPATAGVTSASIPVSGLNSTGAESYGGKYISHVAINAGQTVVLPVQ